MAGATRSTMDAALKDLYLPTMRSVINSATPLLKRLEQRTDMTSVSGRQAVFPVNIRGTQAMGAIADGAALPSPQNQTYVECAIPYCYMYGTVRFTHPTIASTRDNKGAWVKVASSEMDGLTRDIKLDINRQLYGWGYSVIGKLDAASSASTTLTLYTGHNVKRGMQIDVWTALTSGTKQVDGATVVSTTATTAVLSAAVTASDLAYVTRKGSADFSGTSSVSYEMMGLMGIVDDASKTSGIGAFVSTLQGIPRATYPEWNSNVMEHATPGTGRNITATILDEAVMKSDEVSGKKPTIGLCNAYQWRHIGNLLVDDRRYTDTMELDGGFTAIKWAGVPITWDKDVPTDISGDDMLFFLCEDELGRYQLADWDWDDEDGSVLHRNEGYASYDGTLYYYGNFGTTDPQSHVVVRDLLRTLSA